MASHSHDKPPRRRPMRHKTIRIGSDLDAVITQRMIEEGCDESAAIRSLILDGARVERPHPVLAQVAPPPILAQFAADLRQWHRDFLAVRARLALALPDPGDKELCELVAKWRKLAEALLPRALLLAKTAETLAAALVGLSYDELLQLGHVRREVLQNIERITAQKVEPGTEKETYKLQQLALHGAVLKALSVFGV